MATPLILKRGSPSRRRHVDYDVLENGVVVGRILRVAHSADAAELGAGPARDPVQMNKNNPTMLSPANNTPNATRS